MTNTTKTDIHTKIEQRKEAFIDAQTILAGREAELAQVQEEIETVKQGWESGSDEIPASRMVELEAEQKRLVALVKASQRQVQLSERRLLPEQPLLADGIAHALGASVLGIKAEPVLEIPEVEDTDKPYVFVLQYKPHRSNGDGSVGGRDAVKIVLVAPDWSKDLDQTAIERKLQSAGVRLKSEPRLSDRNRTLVIPEVVVAWPEFPYVPYPSPEGSYGFESKTLIERESWFPVEDTSGAFATDAEGKLVETEVTEDGFRETAVELVFSVRNNPEVGMGLQWAQDQGERIVTDQLPGKVLAGIGRVTGVEVMGVEPVSNPVTSVSARKITVRVTAKGRA